MRLCNKLLPLVCVALAYGQEESPTFRADTRLVVLHASVIDGKGHLLTELKKDSFKVFENKVEQPIKIFRREDVPVSMALVIDNSGSMRDKRKKVEAAALALVKASNPRDEVTIVNFNDEAYQDVLFTADIKKMEEGLTRIDARGGTAMRDALSMTIDYMKDKAKHDKKVIVAVTDGDDNASVQINLEKLVAKAHQSEILIYTVGLLNEDDKREGRKAKRAMQAISDASGGLAAFPKELAEVDKIALEFANEIRNQYIIAYTPTNAALDGTFRAVRVTVNGPNKPTVRTRTGYYATPEAGKRTAAQMSQATK